MQKSQGMQTLTSYSEGTEGVAAERGHEGNAVSLSKLEKEEDDLSEWEHYSEFDDSTSDSSRTPSEWAL